MSYATLMVNLDLEHANDARLRITGDLAEKFGSHVIGITASMPVPDYYTGGAFASGIVAQERADVRQRMTEAEDRFRAAMENRAKSIEWRCELSRPTDYVAREARAADVVITGSDREGILLNALWRVDPSNLVIQAGRPILIVPPETDHLNLKHVLVAWKDTREARRAVTDALPLLHHATEVNVMEVVEDGSDVTSARRRVDDVTAWLRRRGVAAFSIVVNARKDAEEIQAIWENGADLVVAGAYGHTRLQELVLGGVTRSLLGQSRHCSLLSH